MATLNTQSFAQIVQGFAAAVQARSTSLVDFSVGSILRSIAEADAANALWLQALIIQTLAVTRAQTSNGLDLDTFVNQFGVIRLGATSATGLVTFSRNTVSASAPFIPIGSLVKTSDGSQQFAVYADPTNGAYIASPVAGYTLAANVASVNVPVQAVTGGIQGNVLAGTITLIASTFSGGGIDTVVNGAPFVNGVNAETDPQLRARLILYFNQLAKATEAALTYAIQSLQVGLKVAIHEQTDPGGATDYGMVTIYVDDGSGAPPASLITACNVAVNLVRAAGVRVNCYAATTLIANYSMTLTTAPGYVHATVVGLVGNAVSAFINAVGLEDKLPYSQLAAVAYGIAGVTNVTSVLLNSATADLIPAAGQTIKVGSAVVS